MDLKHWHYSGDGKIYHKIFSACILSIYWEVLSMSGHPGSFGNTSLWNCETTAFWHMIQDVTPKYEKFDYHFVEQPFDDFWTNLHNARNRKCERIWHRNKCRTDFVWLNHTRIVKPRSVGWNITFRYYSWKLYFCWTSTLLGSWGLVGDRHS